MNILYTFALILPALFIGTAFSQDQILSEKNLDKIQIDNSNPSPTDVETIKNPNQNSIKKEDLPSLELELITKSSQENNAKLSNGSEILIKERSDSEAIKSIMYNEKDLKNIKSAINSFKNKGEFSLDSDKKEGESEDIKIVEKQDNTRSYVYLASILYISANNWSVWIGDRKITSNTNKKENELFLTLVSEKEVSVVWSLSVSKWRILFGANDEDIPPSINKDNQVENRFKLKINQTYSLSSGKISNGKTSSLKRVDKENVVDAVNQGAESAR